MSNNMDDLFANVKKMVDSGNIPSEVQGLMNNLNNGNNDSKQTLNNMLSQVSPEMLNNLSSMLQSNASQNNSCNNTSNTVSSNSSVAENSSNNFNIDPATLMKMTSLINSLNKKDNPGNNLLHSLKPYLRNSRKDKIDQYANLLNITRIADAIKNDKKENK